MIERNEVRSQKELELEALGRANGADGNEKYGSGDYEEL